MKSHANCYTIWKLEAPVSETKQKLRSFYLDVPEILAQEIGIRKLQRNGPEGSKFTLPCWHIEDLWPRSVSREIAMSLFNIIFCSHHILKILSKLSTVQFSTKKNLLKIDQDLRF